MRKRIGGWKTAALALAVLAADGAPAVAQGAKPGGGAAALFVLDASGSMMAKIEGKPKIDLARAVMTDVMKSLDPDVRTGLVVYGHRSKDDCGDIELVAPLGTERDAIVASVNSLHAKGKTPITDSMRMAVAQFAEYEGAASVVVVSDGLETCEGDPCAAAREAVASGVKLRIHVVGFDLKPEEAAELQCIAREGKGKYFAAASARDLSTALVEVQKELVAAVPTATPEPTAAPTATEAAEPTARPQPTAPEANLLPRGGHGTADAIPLAPGDYTMNWSLASNVYEYWSFEAKPAQLVKVVLKPATQAYTGGTLYGPEEAELVKETCTSSAGQLPWLTSAKQETHRFHLAVGGCNGVARGAKVELSITDVPDGSSGTDAGDDFGGALSIPPGKLRGHVAGQWGDDVKDFYAVPMKAGDALSVKVVPPSDAQVELGIYDQDRVRVVSKASANAGAIARGSWTATEDQEAVYVSVERLCSYCKLEKISYELDVRLESKTGADSAADRF